MDTAFPQKIPFILDRNLEKANCTEDRICTSCDKVVLGQNIFMHSVETIHICKLNFKILLFL